MASASQSVGVRPVSRVSRILGRGGVADRYFYFFLSLVVAGIVLAGFSRTVDRNLFHAAPPRPVLLWIHGAAFSGWVVFFILQSALVRVRKVSVHRTLGWFGAVLGATMVTLGCVIAVVMGRFDALQLQQPVFRHAGIRHAGWTGDRMARQAGFAPPLPGVSHVRPTRCSLRPLRLSVQSQSLPCLCGCSDAARRRARPSCG